MIDNITTLKRAKNFAEVHRSYYFQKHFVERYINDMPRFAYELFGVELTYQQVEMIEKHDWEGGRLACPSGHGCHGIDTPIMMYDGSIKAVQDVRVGDKLMGDDGISPRNVLSLARGKEEMYRFRYRNGVERVYNKSHILYLYAQPKMEDIAISVGEFIKNTDDEYFDDYNAYLYSHELKKNTRLDIEDIEPIGIDNYYGFELDGNNLFLDGDCIVSHNTGKTFSISILAVFHMMLFPESITRIQAPKAEQVTKFSFKEIKNKINALDMPRRINGRLVVSEWAFLKRFFQLNTSLIYIKGFKEQWYIEPATAPKGDPTNLSGQHNKFYLLIFDECSGVPDSHIDGSLGALSERFNSCIAFSQHTRTSGRFHQWVTTHSKEHGGVWDTYRLNSEQSPRVTAKAIKNWRETYDENEYNVRVLGQAPIFEDGFLLNGIEASKVYERKSKTWIDTLNFHTLTLSVDIAYTGLRDSSVVTTMRVATKTDVTGKMKIYVIVDDIGVYRGNNKKLPTEVSEEAFKLLLLSIQEIENTPQFLRLPIDATAGGHEAYTKLDELVSDAGLGDAHVQPITWGSGRLVGFDKKRFLNQRAKANILLKEAVSQNRLYIATNKYKTRVLNELSHIPFKFTVDFRYKILSKDEMAKKGIKSPDIIDTIAQQFLVPYLDDGKDLMDKDEVDIGIVDEDLEDIINDNIEVGGEDEPLIDEDEDDFNLDD